jgi:hypothetical protein
LIAPRLMGSLLSLWSIEWSPPSPALYYSPSLGSARVWVDDRAVDYTTWDYEVQVLQALIQAQDNLSSGRGGLMMNSLTPPTNQPPADPDGVGPEGTNSIWIAWAQFANYCNMLRDDGLSLGDYVEQLTFLLFLKMADE